MTVRYLGIVPRVPVVNLERMAGFYSGTLGFTVDMRWPDDTPTFAMLSRDDAELQLYVVDDATRCGAIMLNVAVTDALAVHAELAGRILIEWGPAVYWYGRREFAVRDPEGNLVIITAKTDDPPTDGDNS